MKRKIFVGLILLFSTPFSADAAVRVTEVMYDLPGADSGREWVEVMSDSEVDLKDFKFFNKDGGHLLKAYGTGPTIVPAGGVAIIADKPDLFLADWPAYAGILIDSSFSLVTSDTVGIKDAEGNTVSSVSYSSDAGAKGDGNTLQFAGGAVSAAVPSPGSVSGVSVVPQTQAQSTDASSTTSESATSANEQTAQKAQPLVIKRIVVDAGGDRTVTVGASSLFSAKVFGIKGEPILNPRIVWNFGNGEIREGQTVSFTYMYPGTYNLVVDGVSGEYSGSDRITLEAKSSQVSLMVETDGTLVLLNSEKRELDVSLWLLVRGEKSFRIPTNTIISGGGKIPFSTTTTGFGIEGEAQLQYPNGSAAGGIQPPATSTLGVTHSIVSAVTGFIGSKGQGASVVSLRQVDVQNEQSDQSEPSEEVPWFMWFSGALGLGVLGAASVLLMRSQPTANQKSDAASLADTYEIIE